MNTKELVEKFQCPGCVAGSDAECGNYQPNEQYGAVCKSHVLGTSIGAPNNKIALGLPKGFNKPGVSDDGVNARNTINLRLWSKDAGCPDWDNLNIPVWAMIEDGFLFVRTYCPRLNFGYVDVIEGGDFDVLPESTIDVGKFIDEID